MISERARAAGFVDCGYQLIYADPPWAYRDKANAGNRGACHKYQVMSMADIAKLPIADIAAPDCMLAMWWVPPQPAEALALVDAWGFKLRNMKLFTWRKLTKTGLRHFGMGHWTRGNTEDVLIATQGDIEVLDPWESEDVLIAARGKPKRINAGISQLIDAPIREHSRKPDEVAERLIDLVGPVKRIELFARRRRCTTWDYWGNEL